MKKGLYNVIWADDKTSVYNTQGEDNELVDILDLKGIRIIDTARNAEELATKLEKRLSWVDAVITDANYLSMGDVPTTTNQLSGFYDAARLFRTYGKSGNKIPFLVWSGRSIDFIEKRCTEDGYQQLDFLEYIKEHDLYFNKTESELEYLFNKLIEEVDRINTPEHQLRVRYYDAFEAASAIEGAEEELMNCLLIDFNHEKLPATIKDRFNAIRRLFDKLYDACKAQGLLPRMPLNSIPKLLDVHDLSGAAPFSLLEGEAPMHQALVKSFALFLEFVQDGSHANNDLDISVLDYVQQSNSQNLLQSVVHIAMDLLLWYQDASEKYKGRKFWKGNYKAQGYVQELPRKSDTARRRFTFDNFVITPDDNNPLSEGDFVGIKDYTKDDYWGNNKVAYYQYDIIEKHKNN